MTSLCERRGPFGSLTPAPVFLLTLSTCNATVSRIGTLQSYDLGYILAIFMSFTAKTHHVL